MYKMKNSVQFKRRLNHFLTYLYMVVLSIVIIYPLRFYQPSNQGMSVPLHLILVAILVLITSQNFSLKLIMALGI